MLEFSDLLENWDGKDDDGGGNDDDAKRSSIGDNGSEISCDLGNITQEQDGERESWRWDVLYAMDNERDEGTTMSDSGAMDEEKMSMHNNGMSSRDNGGVSSASPQQQQQQNQGYPSVYSFPPMASYESMMLSNNHDNQLAQPHPLHHPLAMTSLSSCPPHINGSFPGNGSSHESGGSSNPSPNGVTYNDSRKAGGEGNAQSSSMPQMSIVSRSSGSNAASSQTGSQATSRSYNGSSTSSNSNHNDTSRAITNNTNHPFLPSWNDSMGNLMYSSLFNVGIPNTTTNNLDGTTINPFECTPLNSAFNTNATNNAATINHHYGMAINGFHPQVNASVNPILPLINTMPAQGTPSAISTVGGLAGYGSRTGTTSPGTVKTSNAGKSASGNAPVAMYSQQSSQQQQQVLNQTQQTQMHQSQQQQQSAAWLYNSQQKQQQQQIKKAAKERNEREQIRAKKITQLINELRTNMQKEGWKEEMKSKYETLSQCKAYMEYLKRSHKEKENDIEHTKKLIEEKALLEARSDPESIPGSVTSSLTASSGRSTSPEENGSDKESSSSSDNDQGQKKSRKKRKTISYAENTNKASTSQENSNKKLRSTREKRKSPSSTESSSEDDAGNEGEGPGGKNISFDKTSSSVSDMTDSNRSSVDGAGANKGKQGQQQAQSKNELGAASIGTSSISSTAAVMRGSSHKSPQSNRHHLRGQTTTTMEATTAGIGEKKKKPHKKKRRWFEYDYKEVFLKSNLPQLIATLSGRVVVWNDFFLVATGLSDREAKSLSIFSIVESGQLTNLYKFVARALAENKLPVPSAAAAAAAAASEETPSPPEKLSEEPMPDAEAAATAADTESWEAITLKCIRFASKKNKEKTTHPNPLYLTVALMSDEDRDQRCFHCIITDCPGTKGAFGSVTPELLAMLFTTSEKGNAKDGVE